MREEGKTCGSLLAKRFTPWAARPLAAAGAGRSHTLTHSHTPTGIDKGYDKDNSRTHALTHSRTPPLPHTPTRDRLSSRQTSQPSFIENAAIISPNSGKNLRYHAENASAIWRLLISDTTASSAAASRNRAYNSESLRANQKRIRGLRRVSVRRIASSPRGSRHG